MAARGVKLMALGGVFRGLPGVFQGALGTDLAGGLMVAAWRQTMTGSRQKPAGVPQHMPQAPTIAAG